MSSEATVENKLTIEDTPLVEKHTVDEFAAVDEERWAKIRLFFAPHHMARKLPQMPVVMFVHGLGGQLDMFSGLLEYFSHFAGVIAVELPGCGRTPATSFRPAYSPEGMTTALLHALDLTGPKGMWPEKVVLVGHSMGSQLAARMALELGERCVGLVCLCPPYEVDPKMRELQKTLEWMPAMAFDAFRAADRVGGLTSASINRMVNKDLPADSPVRRRQLRWNLEVNTRVWMAMASQFETLTPDQWAQIQCPVLLVGAEDDQVTPPEPALDKILSWLPASTETKKVKTVMVHDAGHAVMIERPEVVCGVIGDFVAKHVDERLSMAWQLAYVAAQSDKWSLKNEAKWRSVQPVGAVIPACQLLGMKTLRQNDDVHSPALLEADHPEIAAIIDISRERPPYEPETFTRIVYHKFPTVSKVPPPKNEVRGFIELVDEVRKSLPSEKSAIAVHCHYGFNRTGFFIACYLIERCNFSVKDAIAAFAESRPPGIKHDHFIDKLHVRYSL